MKKRGRGRQFTSEGMKGNTFGFKKGQQFWLGKKRLNTSGEKNHFWKGGVWQNPYPENWTETLREAIRQRDNFVCQLCGIHQDELNGRFKILDCHHIDYDKENCDPKNLVSLCRLCHLETNGRREYWKSRLSIK